MIRAIGILLTLTIAVSVALYLAKVGGSVEIRVGDTFVGVSFPIALLLLSLLFLIGWGFLALIGALRRWPAKRRAKREAKRRAQGEQVLTRALVALAAGNADVARLEVRKARGLLGETPNLLLLSAEADRLAGREDAAAEAFQALAQREDSQFLGLRGLLRQAVAREDWAEAM
jgi:HemY protein